MRLPQDYNRDEIAEVLIAAVNIFIGLHLKYPFQMALMVASPILRVAVEKQAHPLLSMIIYFIIGVPGLVSKN
jgi:hypothetical protein